MIQDRTASLAQQDKGHCAALTAMSSPLFSFGYCLLSFSRSSSPHPDEYRYTPAKGAPRGIEVDIPYTLPALGAAVEVPLRP